MAAVTHLVLTHDDADHIGGAAAIVTAMRPREVWLACGWERRVPSGSLQRLRAAIRRAGCRVRTVQGGEAFCLRGVRIEILHPSGTWAGSSSENDASLVLRAASAGRAALLMADAGHPAEQLLPPDRLRADLLKVGHHGSRGSTGPRLLAGARPRVAVISCGKANRFGHPHPAVLAALHGAGARICRTDLHGTLQLDLLAAGTVVTPLCGRVSLP
jgi:competence protein ComEC